MSGNTTSLPEKTTGGGGGEWRKRNVKADAEKQLINPTRVAARRTRAETAPQTLRTYQIEINNLPAPPAPLLAPSKSPFEYSKT